LETSSLREIKVSRLERAKWGAICSSFSF